MLSALTLDPVMAPILDSMADGQWHSMTKILKNNPQATKELPEDKGDELRKRFETLAEEGIALVGDNNSQRFTVESLLEWRELRGMESQPQTISSPRFFGGLLEDDGWEHAPLRSYDVIHFRGTGEVTEKNVQKIVGSRGFVTQDVDGLFRIMSLYGDDISEELKEWGKTHAYDLTGVCLNKKTMRREITELPSEYFDDLCAFYGSFAYTLLRRNMSTLKKHIPDNSDVQQQIFLWIIDAVQRYNHTTCIPFAAYLAKSLNLWVHDLGRKTYGRSASDNELKLSRAIASFKAEYNREPTYKELAVIFDEPEDKIKQKVNSVSTVNSLRNMTTIDSEDFDIPIPVHDSLSTMEDLNQTLLSASLTSATIKTGADPVSWLHFYQTIWGSKKQTSVSVLAQMDDSEIEKGKQLISAYMRESLRGEVI